MHLRSSFESFLTKLEDKKLGYEAHSGEYQKAITAAIEVKISDHLSQVESAPSQTQKTALVKLVQVQMVTFLVTLLLTRREHWYLSQIKSQTMWLCLLEIQ